MPMLLLNVMTSWCLVTVLHCSVWGAGVWPLLALGTHEVIASSATLLPAADIPHHIISVLQTMNNYLPSRLSSPSSTLAGGARLVLVHAIQASLCCLFIT